MGMIACFFKLEYLLDDGADIGQRLVFKINKSEAALADEISDGTIIRMSRQITVKDDFISNPASGSSYETAFVTGQKHMTWADQKHLRTSMLTAGAGYAHVKRNN